MTGGGAIAIWVGTAGSPTSHFPIWQAYALGAVALAALYMTFASVLALPLTRTRREIATPLDLPVPAGDPPAAPTVNQAVWKAVCDETGEFPDTKTLTFRLKQVPVPGSAIRDFTALRCTVTDPAQVTVESTGTESWRPYTPYFFPGTPQVRPGLYLSRWQGRLQAGEWTDIASGEHEVQPPPKTGLEVVITDEKRTPFPGVASILEIEYSITNHDPVAHELRSAIRGVSPDPQPPTSDPEFLAALREEHAIRQRRNRDTPLPGRVEPHETVQGVYVTRFPWNPTGRFPEYTLVIRTERDVYTARPHGVGEDPLAAWPID